MHLTDLEIAALRGHYLPPADRTPEDLARELGVTLGEIREAEKTALRKADPLISEGNAGDSATLTPLEAAVLCHLRQHADRPRPEDIAASMDTTVCEVLEAVKSGLGKLEDPAHASVESLRALGIR